VTGLIELYRDLHAHPELAFQETRTAAIVAERLREPEITRIGAFPPVVNDPAACARTQRGFEAEFGPGRVFDPGPLPASEDVGVLATAAGAPCVFWLLGGADPAAFDGASTFADVERVTRGQPSNHSPLYAPVDDPTLDLGVRAIVSAAHTWLPTTEEAD